MCTSSFISFFWTEAVLLHEQRFDHLLLNLDLFANVVFDAQGQESFRPCKLRNVRTQSKAESPTLGEITRMPKRTFPLNMSIIYISEHLEQELNSVIEKLLVVTVRGAFRSISDSGGCWTGPETPTNPLSSARSSCFIPCRTSSCRVLVSCRLDAETQSP